jgi:hypothetical protein
VQTLAAEISTPGPRRALGYFRCWQMLSKKSFLADERNFLGLLSGEDRKTFARTEFFSV